MKLACILTGHNKFLEKKIEDGHEMFYTVCSQCNQRQFNENLSDKPKMQPVKKSIQVMQESVKQNIISVKHNLPRHTKGNFYSI